MRLLTGIAIGVLLFGTAACGGSDDETGIATANGTPAATASAGPGGGEGSVFEFAACMRENGVPMEDPKVNPDGTSQIKIAIPKGIDKAVVDAAQKKCRPLMPNGGEMGKANPEQLERMRAMSRCMRENGFPAFPDPSPQGGIQIGPDSGLNPDDPAFQAAQEKCEPEGGGMTTDKDGR